jgi:hypothetical protein
VQLMCGELEAEMARGCFERAQRIHWRQDIGHGADIIAASAGEVATDFL